MRCSRRLPHQDELRRDAGAAVGAGQELVRGVSAARARQVVTQVVVVLIDGVPHGLLLGRAPGLRCTYGTTGQVHPDAESSRKFEESCAGRPVYVMSFRGEFCESDPERAGGAQPERIRQHLTGRRAGVREQAGAWPVARRAPDWLNPFQRRSLLAATGVRRSGGSSPRAVGVCHFSVGHRSLATLPIAIRKFYSAASWRKHDTSTSVTRDGDRGLALKDEAAIATRLQRLGFVASALNFWRALLEEHPSNRLDRHGSGLAARLETHEHGDAAVACIWVRYDSRRISQVHPTRGTTMLSFRSRWVC